MCIFLPANSNARMIGLNVGLKYLENNKDFHFCVNTFIRKLLLIVLNNTAKLAQKVYLFTEYLFITTMTILM